MSFTTLIEEPDATGETAEMYAIEHERVGYLPRYAQVFGDRPGVYRAWRQLIGEVTSSMPTRRFELVTLAAARELRSTYCCMAHGSILTDRFLAADAVAQLAQGGVPDTLDDSERAVVDFAAKTAHSAADITADDVEGLRRNGLDDAEILDVVLATAARCFFSTVLDATGTRADAIYSERLDPVLRDALTVGRPVADQ
jgi:uncharacterized peroxidase-related enzyme